MEMVVKKVLTIIIVIVAIVSLTTILFVFDGSGITGGAVSGAAGGATGVAKVFVTCFVAMSLPQSEVNFGAMMQGYSDNTTDDNPLPLLLQNDGGIHINITIARNGNSTPLFSGTGGGDNTSSFQFKIDQGNETSSFDVSNSLTSWTYVPGTTSLEAVAWLNYTDSKDSVEVDLLINVPGDESSGSKQETLNFIAYASDPGECEIPSGDEADCLEIDTSGSEIRCGPEKLIGVEVENVCNYSITITQAKVNWGSDGGELIEKVKFDPAYAISDVWSKNCNWGCSPVGMQSSGTWLDFGDHDYVLDEGSKKIKQMWFDSCMENKTFEIEFKLSDDSTKSSGSFQP